MFLWSNKWSLSVLLRCRDRTFWSRSTSCYVSGSARGRFSSVFLTLSLCVTFHSFTLLILNSSFFPHQLLFIFIFLLLIVCSLLPFRSICLSSIIFAVSLSLDLGQSEPGCHLLSISLCFWYWIFVPSTLTAISPVFSPGIKNPCRPLLPCEWISYPGFKEISLLCVPWRLSQNTMSLFVLSPISPIRERGSRRQAGRRKSREWRVRKELRKKKESKSSVRIRAKAMEGWRDAEREGGKWRPDIVSDKAGQCDRED